MRKLTARDKAEIKMESAIWIHGRKKGVITAAINKLKETGFGDNHDVKKVIEFLIIEREKLKKVELF